MKKYLFVILAAVFLAAASPLHADINTVTDAKTQYCYSYIKGLKALWFEIHRKGVEQVMREHPPEDEGMDSETALFIGNEIASIDPAHAQAWIEEKWNACIADPQSVRR